MLALIVSFGVFEKYLNRLPWKAGQIVPLNDIQTYNYVKHYAKQKEL